MSQSPFRRLFLDSCKGVSNLKSERAKQRLLSLNFFDTENSLVKKYAQLTQLEHKPHFDRFFKDNPKAKENILEAIANVLVFSQGDEKFLKIFSKTKTFSDFCSKIETINSFLSLLVDCGFVFSNLEIELNNVSKNIILNSKADSQIIFLMSQILKEEPFVIARDSFYACNNLVSNFGSTALLSMLESDFSSNKKKSFALNHLNNFFYFK